MTTRYGHVSSTFKVKLFGTLVFWLPVHSFSLRSVCNIILIQCQLRGNSFNFNTNNKNVNKRHRELLIQRQFRLPMYQ